VRGSGSGSGPRGGATGATQDATNAHVVKLVVLPRLGGGSHRLRLRLHGEGRGTRDLINRGWPRDTVNDLVPHSLSALP
jgi:hypothetical protein